MSTTNNNAQRLAAYRKRLEDSGFKRVSAYVSLELIAYLQSKKAKGECIGRTLERLLLGNKKDRPKYYSKEEIARKESRRQGWAAQRTQPKNLSRAEHRVLRRAEFEQLRREAMERLGLLTF